MSLLLSFCISFVSLFLFSSIHSYFHWECTGEHTSDHTSTQLHSIWNSHENILKFFVRVLEKINLHTYSLFDGYSRVVMSKRYFFSPFAVQFFPFLSRAECVLCAFWLVLFLILSSSSNYVPSNTHAHYWTCDIACSTLKHSVAAKTNVILQQF